MDGTEKAADGAKDEPGRETSGDSEQTSGDDQGTSAIDVGKQYSGAETKKLVEDALAKDGRAQKGRADAAVAQVGTLTSTVAELTTKYETLAAQTTERQTSDDDAEREKLKDDPTGLTAFNRRLEFRQRAIALDDREAGIDAKQKVLDEGTAETEKTTLTGRIRAAAVKAEVSLKDLTELCPDGDPGRLERAAGVLRKGGSVPDEGADKDKPPGLTQRPVSARRASGPDSSGMTADQKITAGLAQAKKR